MAVCGNVPRSPSSSHITELQPVVQALWRQALWPLRSLSALHTLQCPQTPALSWKISLESRYFRLSIMPCRPDIACDSDLNRVPFNQGH